MLKRTSQEYDYQEETLLLQKAANMCVLKNETATFTQA